MTHTPQDFDKAVEHLPALDKQIAELLEKRVDQSEAYQCLVEAINEQRTGDRGSQTTSGNRLHDT